MNFSAPIFQPNVPAPVAPVKVEPPKPVEPPKEKHVLLLERIVKGSETDVKSAELSEEDSTKVNSIKDIVSVVQKDKKISLQSLTDILVAMKDITNLPKDLVSKSVH